MRAARASAAALLLGCPRGEPTDAAAGTTTTAPGSSEADTSATTSTSVGSESETSTSTAADTSSDGASSDGSSTGDAPPSACMLSGAVGECVDVTACASSAFAWLGGCGDGPPSLQCCLPEAIECSKDGAAGLCLPSAECPRGLERTAGLCPGDADVQCCSDPALACDPDAMPLPNEGLVEPPGDAGCPDGMIAIATFCIDRVEASLVRVDDSGTVLGSFSPYWNPDGVRVRAVALEGGVPQGYIDQQSASAACMEAGKRLCDDDEWLRACQGAAGHTYPYGDAAMPGVCNDARARHPAIEYFGTSESWIYSELGNPCILQIPDGVQTGGAHPGCASEDGVLDMMGNLHEWTSDPAGTFRGGFFVDTVLNGPGCLYATTAHDVSHWDYSTGFRCCADPR